MLEELETIHRLVDNAIQTVGLETPPVVLSDLIQAQIDLRRQIARLKRETPATGFLEAFTAVLAEIEWERNRWQDLIAQDEINPTTSYRLGCRRGLGFALRVLEPLHERLEDQEARRGRH